MVNNGDKVRHKITGLEGVVMGITDWIYGCKRIHVQPFELRDGRPQDYIPFDEPEVEVIQAKFLVAKAVKKPARKSTGGPRDYNVVKSAVGIKVK